MEEDGFAFSAVKAGRGENSPPDCFLIPLLSNPFVKKQRQSAKSTLTLFGGGRWIRTIEAEKQQIYSLPPLATRELVQIGSAFW